ncbi:MAG: hypothetical protein POELPBGB_00131 [Bacteroidia bacterium]|nr:hypothetical protein [Bacteroidia bacterium]
MFSPEKIKSIKNSDRVLEIGPGGMPHPRADILLEKRFNDAEWFAQSGNIKPDFKGKPVIYYEGGKFPFKDKEFDYVICSHVLEHVSNIDEFTSELKRVAQSGYIEFPTIYYDYIYNFDVHVTFLLEKNGKVLWMPKAESDIQKYKKIQLFFKQTLDKGKYDKMIYQLREFFFQGFEWEKDFETIRVYDINDVCYDTSVLNITEIIDLDKQRIKLLEERLDAIEKSKSYRLSNKLSIIFSMLKFIK